jgi:CubicO group peptidase (beta-lactamase class C family)
MIPFYHRSASAKEKLIRRLQTSFMRFQLFRFLLLIVVCGAHWQITFCQSNAELRKRVGEIAAANGADDNFSGSVLLAKNGEIVYEKSFGFADREKRRAFTENTASNVASVGKMLTAVLILQLAEEKKLRLSDLIKKLLPNTKILNADRITVHHLLTHTSGLGSYMRHADYAKLLVNKIEINDIIALIEQQPLVFDEPGARFEYSNSGYVVLGKIVKQTAGKRYADVLAEKILQPLNLQNTKLAQSVFAAGSNRRPLDGRRPLSPRGISANLRSRLGFPA